VKKSSGMTPTEYIRALVARKNNAERKVQLALGDSAYVTPMTGCRFEVSS